MCRSIKTLRPPYTEDATSEDSRAAALQYVRKIAGMRAPSKANTAAFEAAVAAVTQATDELLSQLVVAGSTHSGHSHAGAGHAHSGRTAADSR